MSESTNENSLNGTDTGSECSGSEISQSTNEISSTTHTQNNIMRNEIDPELSIFLQRRQPKFVPSAPKCARCDKSVYKAEEVRAINKTFHKLCFKCKACNKLLEPNLLTEHQGDLFCRTCYSKHWGPKGYGFGSGSGIMSPQIMSPAIRTDNIENNNVDVAFQNSLITATTTPTLKSTFSTYSNFSEPASSSSSMSLSNSVSSNTITALTDSNNTNTTYKRQNSLINSVALNFGSSDKCARCNKSVYAAEKVVAAGRPFHKLCFACSLCNRLLNSMNCCDNNEGTVFCKTCYGKNYGPKGVGHGLSAGTLQAN